MGYIFFKKSRMQDAIQKDEIDTVRSLLDKGLDPNLRDEYGRSFLYYAVLHGREEIADLLIASGANAEHSNRRYNGNVLHLTAEIGNVGMGERLLKNFPDLLHVKDKRGNTPLHVAAAEGNSDFVIFLISQGAATEAKNTENRTPLYLARKSEHAETAKILEHYQPPPLTPENLPNLPPPAGIKDEVQPGWKKLEGDSVAHVRIERAIGYKLTEVFNFSTRERTRLYQNLATKAEVIETHGFDEIVEKEPLEEALRQLSASGAKTDHLSVRGIAKGAGPARR